MPDVGRRATVIAAGPRARGFFGAPDSGPVLGAGTELLLRDGPVTADGYDWYLAYFAPAVDAQNPFELETGWVAAGLSGQEATLIEIGPVRCPAVPMTVAFLGSMTDLARRECLGEASFEVHGVAENCYLDGIHPYVVKPEWLGPFCRYRAYELGTNASVPIHFPPSLLIPNTLSRGDLVRIVGHVNDAAAEDCLPVPTGEVEVTESQTALALQQAVLACRSAFVVSELQITGHIDLANPLGF